MSLVTLGEILENAEEGNYAVGAFNVNNMEIIQALVECATEESSPLILQASQGAIKYAGIDYIVGLVKTAAELTHIPIALHLDHGTSFDQNMMCIRKGFSSIMYDGSEELLEDNISKTKEVVRIAHAVGVSVEGELGRIAGTEDNINVEEEEAFMTDPEEAKTFVKETGVDALAVAIGTAHGPYKGKQPKLDFERLEKISKLTKTPVVLHGASGVTEESIRKAIELGVRKINIDTNIREAFTRGVRGLLKAKPDEYDPRKILSPAKEEMKKVIKEKIRLFECAGKV